MKYIRTKDGKIFEKEYFSYESILQAYFYHGKFVDCKEPIKEADSIEELCDEFVLVGISGIPYGVKQLVNEEDKHNKDFLINLIKSQEYELYGAIWTDKGLIYVAKMNDKGELELL